MPSCTYVVGTAEGADFPSLSEALEAASANDVLQLEPGTHKSALPLKKDVVLTAASTQGNDNDNDNDIATTLISPVIEGNVTLRNIFVRGRVDVLKGHTVIEECNIYDGPDGIRVGGGCRLTLKNSRVNHCSVGGIGVYFMKGSMGEVVNTDVYECRAFGIQVDGGNVVLQGNRIRDSACGIHFRRHASGLIVENSIEYIKNFGIYVTESSSPVVRSNRVQHCGIQCAYVSKGSEGTFSDNYFEGSVHVLPNCNTKFIENRITGFADIDSTPSALLM